MLAERDRIVSDRYEPLADVVHQDGAPARRRMSGAVFPQHPHDRLVETIGQPVKNASFPEFERDAAEAARGSHGPVAGQIEMLQHVRAAVDLQALKACAGLAGRIGYRLAPGRAGQQAGNSLLAVTRRDRPPLSH